MAYTPNSGRWVKITKTFTDFATAGLSNTITVYSLPARSVIHQVVMHHTQQFVGGIIASYTLSVGVSGGNPAKYLAASTVFVPVDDLIFYPAASVTPLSATPENFGAATNITMTAISTVSNLNAAVSGSVDVYFYVSTLP